ncbi:hypothetical protein RB653_009300 [Dictyostelium firmibasis]|uniref:Uncharacterized protein n=1 Tax=Dictyostelium firmibasis TaxID=79012 RepID=A0AAN7U5Z7_9MYCE
MKLLKSLSIILIILILNLINNTNSIEINENNKNELLEKSSNSNSLENMVEVDLSIKSLNSLDLSNKVIDLYSKIPRYSFNGIKIDNKFSPNNRTYIESIILTGSPFELIIIITVLLSLISLLVKLFIKIHKWRKNKSQLNKYKHLLGNSNSKHHYNKNKKPSIIYICSTVITIILLLAVCSFLFISIFVNKDLDQSITISIDNLESHLNNRVEVENRIIKECEPITSIPYDALEIVSTTKQILNVTKETKEILGQYGYYRYQFIFILILSLFAVISLGLLSIIIKYKFSMIPLFISIGLFIVCVGVWVVPSTHVPMGVVISDICPNMDEIISEYAPESINPYLYFFLNCTGRDDFNFIYAMLDDKIETTQNSLDRAKSHHYSNTTINKLQSKLDDLKDLSRDAKDILNCKITKNTFKSTKDIICIDIINSSFILSILFILIGLLLSISFITSMIIYSKPKQINNNNNNNDNSKKSFDSPKKTRMIKSKNININSGDDDIERDGSLTPLLSTSLLSGYYDDDNDETEASSISSPFASPSNRYII